MAYAFSSYRSELRYHLLRGAFPKYFKKSPSSIPYLITFFSFLCNSDHYRGGRDFSSTLLGSVPETLN